jgi:hypothetical protein
VEYIRFIRGVKYKSRIDALFLSHAENAGKHGISSKSGSAFHSASGAWVFFFD